MVKFGVKNRYIISNFHSLHPLQNTTNVQTKGGKGGQRPFEQCSKTALFSRDGFPNTPGFRFDRLEGEYITCTR